MHDDLFTSSLQTGRLFQKMYDSWSSEAKVLFFNQFSNLYSPGGNILDVSDKEMDSCLTLL